MISGQQWTDPLVLGHGERSVAYVTLFSTFVLERIRLETSRKGSPLLSHLPELEQLAINPVQLNLIGLFTFGRIGCETIRSIREPQL